MTLSQIKHYLSDRDTIAIHLPDGSAVPGHFHVTEVGEVTKNFIDCGGTRRQERVANFQLWSATDYDHRLAPGKLVSIIEMAEKQLGLGDREIEVEYQGADTIAKYGLEAGPAGLQLTGKQTDCLARDLCVLPALKQKLSLKNLVGAGAAEACCSPGGGCC